VVIGGTQERAEDYDQLREAVTNIFNALSKRDIKVLDAIYADSRGMRSWEESDGALALSARQEARGPSQRKRGSGRRLRQSPSRLRPRRAHRLR